jgi:outer membrane biogenesis lipoprotein LolB
MSHFPAKAPRGCFFGIRALLLSVLVMTGVNGCAGFFQPPPSDAAAAREVARWRGHNSDLTQFKGLFRIQIKTHDQTLSLRAALAAVRPGRLRVELLNPLGQPLSSLAGDGEQIYWVSQQDRKLYRFKQSPTALEPIIHIPIGIEAFIEALSGRPPLPAYSTARWIEAPNGTMAVGLTDRWNNPMADLRADDSGRIHELKCYSPDGSLQYEAHWMQWRPMAGYDMPVQVKVISGSGDHITWSVERLWTGLDLPPQTFVLQAPPQAP